MFSAQLQVLHLIGFQRSELSREKRLFQLVLAFCTAICLSTSGYFIIKFHDDVFDAIDAIDPFTVGVIFVVKFSTFYWSRNNFYQLIDQIKEESLTVDAGVLKSLNNFDQKFAKVFFGSGVFVVVFRCVIMRVISILQMIAFGAEFDYQMPFKFALPYDVKSHPTYEVTYFIFCCSSVMACSNNVK